jgi:beta-glucosidase
VHSISRIYLASSIGGFVLLTAAGCSTTTTVDESVQTDDTSPDDGAVGNPRADGPASQSDGSDAEPTDHAAPPLDGPGAASEAESGPVDSGGSAAGDSGDTAATDAGNPTPDSGGSTTDAGADANSSQDTPEVEAQVTALLAQMTQDEKVGQMVMIDYGGGLPSQPFQIGDLATYFLGGVLESAGAAPGQNEPQDWQTLSAQIQSQASATRLKIPVIFGIDAVHGVAKVKGATVFPHGIALGSTGDTSLVTQIEQATASELTAMGISMSFSPDSDVGQDERWGRTYESFGEDPTLVSEMVTAAVQGYQSPYLGAPGSVMACPKHFLGAGGTTWGSGVDGGIDQGDVEVSEALMRSVHLPPFQAAINAGAMAIMVSYSSWQGTKMSASSQWLTDVLKTELGYKGFLLSDYDALAELGGTPSSEAVTGINAGLDMIMMSTGHAAFISDVEAAVTAGTIAQSRIDDAVTRILRAKVIAGLFKASSPGASALSTVGSAAHRQLARKAVQESMVLLENNNARLPLSKSAHIHVAGAGANDVGVQSGGWTLGWNGVTNQSTGPLGASGDIGGTSIVTALQNAATESGNVTYSYDGSGVPSTATVGLVVLYENPYAEYDGDTSDPNFSNTGTGQNPSGHVIYDGLAATVLSNMEATKLPLVLLLVTGRPVRIQSYLPSFDAVVAGWLPGSEGEGVADLLYGDAKFSATLSKSWPMDSTQLPLSSLQTPYDPLYKFGFGLTD